MLTDSGFEDIVYQAGICTSGSLLGAMMGSHYNRAWLIHSIMSEGFERLLLKRFLLEKNPTISQVIADAAAGKPVTPYVIQECMSLVNKYEAFKSTVRQGAIGKTAQFWIMYIDIMKLQHIAHTSVQVNSFELRYVAWKGFLPYYFLFNMMNYARFHGSFYDELETLNSIENIYPGMKSLFRKKGISVQGQDRYPIRTAIDQRGEQTINRDAKTSGGVQSFSTNQSSVLRWCLNRAEAGYNTKSLNSMAGFGECSSIYKPLRPTQIIRSEELVSKVQTVLETEYINPFYIDIEKSQLVNLSSGIPLPDSSTDEIIKYYETGKKLSEDFRRERLVNQSVKFHAPIKRNNYASFSKKVVKIKVGKKVKTLEVNRNVIGSLLSFTAKTGKPIDFERALQHPLSPIPLSICHPDGTRRETVKSKLKGKILEYHINEAVEGNMSKDAIVLDMIAQIQTLQGSSRTYKDFAQKFVKSLPTGYNRVDLVADTYKDFSIKSMERKNRGESSKVLIKSLQSKMPPDFSRLLRNGENKTKLIELIAEYIESSKVKVFNILRCNKIR